MLRMPVHFIQNYKPNSHCTSPKIPLHIIIKYKNSKMSNFYREAGTVDPRSGQPVSQVDSSKSFACSWG